VRWGKIKCAVFGRFVKGKTALLILRSVGVFRSLFCLFIVGRVVF